MHTTLPAARLANLHFVTPQLAVGGDLSASDPRLAARQLDEIVELGITHVVDVRSECSDRGLVAARAPQLRYLHHGMDDAGQSVSASWFERAVAWVERAFAEHSGAVVLTHCHMGINRGPSLGFAVLLAQGWDPVDAIDTVRRCRPQANVWYAADALAWHHARTETPLGIAQQQRGALQAWRTAHPLDVVRLIRQARAAERETP